MSDDATGLVSFRVEDPELASALEDAADSEGSKSKAIRNGLREALLGNGDDVEASAENGLPVKAKEGHRKLVEWTGRGGRIELKTAESILANHLNIQKEAVRKVVVQPLKREGVIDLHQGIHHVSIVVGTLDDEPVSVESDADSTETEIATDGGEARERLDELAAAGAEVGHGE